ncbi:MAG: VWA domain-containing protein [Candidatus Sericytochromatia bacterium]
MNFGNTNYLYFLLLVPFLIFIYIKGYKRKQNLLKKFAGEKLLKKLLNSSNYKIEILKIILIILSFSLAVFSLSSPKYGYKMEEIKRKGGDIIVAVDVSKSMLAEDVKPNRLERAKRKLKDILDILQGDRIGLVAFAGTSFLQCPLTLDYQAFGIFLDYLEPSLIPVGGTSIGNALDTAIKAFPKESKGTQSIILITDGEDQENSIKPLIQTLKDKKIRVFTIGIGKDEGVPIPSEEGLKRDDVGNVVLTKLDSKSLENLSNETGAFFIRSASGDIDVQKIYFEGIKANSKDNDFNTSKRQIWEERFQIFVGLALLFIILEMLLFYRNKSDLSVN